MACERNDLAELPVVIVLPPRSIGEVSIRLVDLRELLLSSGIGIVLWVVLQSQVAIGLLNLEEGGILGHSQDFVVGALAMGILLVEELLFAFMSEAIFIIEFLESSIGVLSAIFMGEVIVVVTPGLV